MNRPKFRSTRGARSWLQQLIFTFVAVCFFNANVLAQGITILTWEEYIDPEIVSAFESKYKTKVHFIYFGDDDERDVMMGHSNGVGYDLICLDEASVLAYIGNDWVKPIATNQIKNYSLISLDNLTLGAEWREYAVPYFWGTVGILYRKDMVSEPINSWKDLYVPSAKLAGKIIMLETTQVLVGMGLKALGKSLDETSDHAFLEVEKLLMSQKPFVAAYRNIHLGERSWLASGKAVAAMAYNGDALVAMELHPELVYSHPAEGGSLWVDFWVISKHSDNEALALKFLDYINRPKVAARNAEYVSFATPNKAAEKHLPKEFLNNESIYPSQEYLTNSQVFPSWSPRVLKRATNIIMRVTR